MLKTVWEEFGFDESLTGPFVNLLGADFDKFTIDELFTIKLRDLEAALDNVKRDGVNINPVQRAFFVRAVRTAAVAPVPPRPPSASGQTLAPLTSVSSLSALSSRLYLGCPTAAP